MSVKKIKDVVGTALRLHLAPSIISDIAVFQETDSDGDPILRIQVVVDRNGAELDADKLFLATGVARAALEKIAETRFPLLSFPASDEMPGVAA